MKGSGDFLGMGVTDKLGLEGSVDARKWRSFLEGCAFFGGGWGNNATRTPCAKSRF